MSDFGKAFLTLLDFEGSEYSDHPADRGGPTRYGINIGTLSDFNGQENPTTIKGIKDMTPELSRDIYRALWWDRYGYAEILSTEVATRVLLAAVNFGAHQGHIIAQRACRAAGQQVKCDGILGPKSMAAINRIPSAIYLPGFRAEAASVYRRIVAKDPSQRVFIEGWLERAYY